MLLSKSEISSEMKAKVRRNFSASSLLKLQKTEKTPTKEEDIR